MDGVPACCRFIDEAGKLQGPAAAIPPMYQLAKFSWRKLKDGYAAQQSGQPAAVSELAEELAHVNPADAPEAGHVTQSSLRLLLRAALTPVGVANDHLDYKALLRNLG